MEEEEEDVWKEYWKGAYVRPRRCGVYVCWIGPMKTRRTINHVFEIFGSLSLRNWNSCDNEENCDF